MIWNTPCQKTQNLPGKSDRKRDPGGTVSVGRDSRSMKQYPNFLEIRSERERNQNLDGDVRAWKSLSYGFWVPKWFKVNQLINTDWVEPNRIFIPA